MSDTPEDERDPRPVSAGAPGEGQAARTRNPGRPAPRAEAAERTPAQRRIGIRELRQHASIYVDLAEKGYTVDITNRGRLVAQLVPVFEPGSPLERLIASGVIEPAEERGGVRDIEPYPAPAHPGDAGPGRARPRHAGPGDAGPGDAGPGQAGQGERR